MTTSIVAKLMELAYKQSQSDLPEHEMEDRLLANLLNESLEFTTDEGDEGEVRFQNLGRGKPNPSTVVTLQVSGIEFAQAASRLTLDFRYVFYKQYGEQFIFQGEPWKFLITSPHVTRLGPSNILIEFVIYGDTVYQVNRCLPVFAEVVRRHQSTLHQRAVEEYENNEWDEDPNVDLQGPITEDVQPGDGFEFFRRSANDESYVREYIKYMNDTDGEFREVIDNRNTYAESEL